jgi:hypothetical protein
MRVEIKCKKAGDPRNRLLLASTCAHLIKGGPSEGRSIYRTLFFSNAFLAELNRIHFFELSSIFREIENEKSLARRGDFYATACKKWIESAARTPAVYSSVEYNQT